MSLALNPSAESFTPFSSSSSSTTTSTTFPLEELHEELILFILSFVTDVPYEESSTATTSMLTNVIPLLNKNFYRFSKSDYLWKQVVLRCTNNCGPNTWKYGLESFNKVHSYAVSQRSNNNNNDIHNNNNNNEILVTNAATCIQHHMESHPRFFTRTFVTPQSYIYIELFRYILSTYIKFTSPLFYMPDNDIKLQNPFGIHFFEPRYRLLINEVMSPYPPEYRTGEPLDEPFNPEQNRNFLVHNDGSLLEEYPTFIYANHSPLKQGSLVTIVQVKSCFIHGDGRADVTLEPMQYGRIESVWERRNSDHLYEARVVKLNGAEEEHEVLDQHQSHLMNGLMSLRQQNPVQFNELMERWIALQNDPDDDGPELGSVVQQMMQNMQRDG